MASGYPLLLCRRCTERLFLGTTGARQRCYFVLCGRPHLWVKPVLPTRWLTEDNFYPNTDDYQPVSDPEKERMDIHEWTLECGDAVAFSFSILHGARGSHSTTRRRAFSLRLLGDDARYVERAAPPNSHLPTTA